MSKDTMDSPGSTPGLLVLKAPGLGLSLEEASMVKAIVAINLI